MTNETTTAPETTPEIDDYQTRLNAERAATRKTYDDLYNGIAACLEGWNVVRDPADDWYNNERIHLADASGSGKKISLSLKTYGAERGKVHVSGWWPQKDGTHGAFTTPHDVNEESPSINCSLSKGYPAIAADIRRRFMPEYHRIYAKCSERIQNTLSYENKQAQNWAKISAVSSVEPHRNTDSMRGDIRIGPARSDEDRYNYDGGYGSIHMSSADSVQIELRSVPIERALAILKAIAEVK